MSQPECCWVTSGTDTTYTWWIPWFIHKEYPLVPAVFQRSAAWCFSLPGSMSAQELLIPDFLSTHNSLRPTYSLRLSLRPWSRYRLIEELHKSVRIFSVMLKSCKFNCPWCCQKHKKSVLQIYFERQNRGLLILQNLNQTGKRHLKCELIFFYFYFLISNNETKRSFLQAAVPS